MVYTLLILFFCFECGLLNFISQLNSAERIAVRRFERTFFYLYNTEQCVIKKSMQQDVIKALLLQASMTLSRICRFSRPISYVRVEFNMTIIMSNIKYEKKRDEKRCAKKTRAKQNYGTNVKSCVRQHGINDHITFVHARLPHNTILNYVTWLPFLSHCWCMYVIYK